MSDDDSIPNSMMMRFPTADTAMKREGSEDDWKVPSNQLPGPGVSRWEARGLNLGPWIAAPCTSASGAGVCHISSW